VSAARLAIVTGKGGVGKTTIAAAIARAAAADGRRVLLVEAARPGRLASVLGVPELTAEPRALGHGVSATALDERAALESLVYQLMPLRLLSRRLLSSETFRIVAAAIPGIPEVALLAQVVSWLEDGSGLRRPRFDLVVLDAPASGHSVPLLAAPQTIAALASVGPLAHVVRRIEGWLRDPARTTALVAAIPEDWAVAEAAELYASLRDALHLPLAPPLLNAVFPRRFSRKEEALVRRAASEATVEPRLLRAALYFARRREAAALQGQALRRATERRPIELPFLFSPSMTWDHLDPLSDALRAAIG
jgi:anion-transporting  ArsA/GET3 family ATPase